MMIDRQANRQTDRRTVLFLGTTTLRPCSLHYNDIMTNYAQRLAQCTVNAFVSINEVAHTPGHVTTWMGDCLRTRKPSPNTPRSTQPSIPPSLCGILSRRVLNLATYPCGLYTAVPDALYLYLTTIQVGLSPVSDEVSSFSSVEEQVRLPNVLLGSSPGSLHGLLRVVRPASPRTSTWSCGLWSPLYCSQRCAVLPPVILFTCPYQLS